MKYILVVNMMAEIGKDAKESEDRARHIAEEMKTQANQILREIDEGKFADIHDWCVKTPIDENREVGAYFEVKAGECQNGILDYPI